MELAHAQTSLSDLGVERLEHANINGQTGLATDYLNHFNEVVMLLEMLPDMPECAEDVLDWRPCSYEEHFRNSCFSEKDLAIVAFYAAPANVRLAFERAVQAVDAQVLEIQEELRQRCEDPEYLLVVRDLVTTQIQGLLSRCNGIIHGRVDARAEGQENTQADVDALFD
ncbi:hypothetical protein [Polycladidibacter hongkongensis]|uniref:hypothetical protein n=1 Tax=Polycladidibacter hongkongensis TaxID=1647556 RepID=UPI00082DF87E|nr:hypothetical protein [Pseudovibrio hongkongensis]